MKCTLCNGTGHSFNTYVKGKCPRCDYTHDEPARPPLHAGMIVRNRRSGKVWAIYSAYDGGDRWGIHRFKPSRRGGHYVWQIRMMTREQLENDKLWEAIGVGDAWDDEIMERDPA